MLDKSVTKVCPIPRAAWGSFIQGPPVKNAPISLNGQQQMQLQPLAMYAQDHELRMFDDSYEMYCIHCAAIGTQAEWFELLKAEVVVTK